ncbi:MAG: J domain-containing protein [Dehalococcoidia bacterium]|nr:J domain-containing protein [Dehalococcoidia bacterium]
MDPWERRWVDYYDLLGLQPSADSVVVSAVYRQLARKYALKVGLPPDEDALRLLNEAKDVLLDPRARARFDRARARVPSAGAARPQRPPHQRQSVGNTSVAGRQHALWVEREADVVVDRSIPDAELLRGKLVWGDVVSVETSPAGPPRRQTERLVLLTNEHPDALPDSLSGLKTVLRITEVLDALPDMGFVPADTAALLAAGPDPLFDCGAVILAFGTVFRSADSTRWFPRLVPGPTERTCLIPTNYDTNVAFHIGSNLDLITRVLVIRAPRSQAALGADAVRPALAPPSGR